MRENIFPAFIGSVHRAGAAIRLLGEGLGLLWYGIRLLWFWMRLAWIFTVRAFLWFFLAVLLWDFTDLLGIPLIQGLKAEIHEAASFPAKLFVKEDPAKAEARIDEDQRRVVREWVQAHCRHITRRNGLWNYFCPLCGKKLIEGIDPPMWQI